MNRKSFPSIEWKDISKGTFRAKIATFGVVDFDGDVTLPGAFPEGKAIAISAYGHTSWMGALPVGKGIVSASDEAAYVDGQFFLDTTAGRDTYNTVKGLEGLQEWSYGYDATAESFNKQELAQFPGAFRILKEVDPFEASPVLRGAGIGTTTQSIKDIDGLVVAGKFLVGEVQAFQARAADRAGLRAKEGRRLSTATRDHLTSLATALGEAATGLRALLDGVDGDSGKSAVPADIQSIFDAIQARSAQEWRQFTEELRIYERASGEA